MLDTEPRVRPAKLGSIVSPASASLLLVYLFSLTIGLLIWWGLSFQFPPIFLPSPELTLTTAIKMLKTGELASSVSISLFRILAGWALGCAIGAVIGIILGWIPLARRVFRSVIEYLRFVPPITLVTLFIIWFGIGEMSKIVLIAWVSGFIVVVNAMAGVMSVRVGAIRAAQCLGARYLQVIFHVVVPEAVPYILTGMQLALSNAFMTIVAAEMLAASAGLGFIIWDAQIYAQTDRVFVAFVSLSILGFCLDRLVHGISRRMLRHYKIV